MHKILLATLILLSLINVAIAQGPPSGWDPSQMKSGTIVGAIFSGEDETPIEYANVVVKDTAGNLVNGVITDLDGKFLVKNIPFGKMVNVELSFIGFETQYFNEIVLTPASPFHRIGKVTLQTDAQVLEAVEITGQKAIVQTSLDKKTYNVDKSTITKSKSASDVLNELPSVSVESDGTISLRGNSNVRILVDGESSLAASGNIELILQQIPAESIEKIDVVTNPSAKYDPEGTSGVINIILKKEKQRGVNGTVSAGIGTWNKYNAATFINYRKNKFGLTANYNFRYFDSFGSSESVRSSTIDGFENILTQESDDDNDNMSHFGRLGLTYNPNKRNGLSFGIMTNFFQFDRDSELNSNTFYEETNSYQDSRTTTLFNGQGIFTNANLYHSIKFNKDNTADAKYGINYSNFNGDFDGGYTSDSILMEEEFFLSAQNTETDAISHTLDVPLDVTIPINENITSEFGLKGSFNWRNSNLYSTSKFDINDEFTSDALVNYDYEYNEQIYAAYANHIHKIKNFSYQIGLRLEEVVVNSKVIPEANSEEKFNRKYFGWYPSVFLRQGFGKNENALHEVQISYSRRINRPSFRLVNPFRDFSDPLNQRQGNPFLQPEFINSFELGYNKVWNKASFNTSLFYKLTTDEYSSITALIDSVSTLTTYDNIGKRHEFGWEIVSKIKVTKWWDIGLDFNIAKRYIVGEGEYAYISSDRLTYGGKGTSTMTYKGFEVQIIGRYRGPNATTQGQSDGFGTMDIALKQSILKNKGTISLSASDLFNTRKRAGFTEGDNFYTDYERRRESRMVWLTFSYGFGKMGEMFNKRSNRRNGGDDDGEQEESLF